MSKQVKLIINPSELGAGTRGASLGPDAMIVAARNKGNTLFAELPSERISPRNELLDQQSKFPFAKNIDGILDVYEQLAKAIQRSVSANEFPLILAGDHASAGGTIAGVAAAHPNKRLGVIWIDAHGDLHSPFTTPSGNVHGMPLSTALAEDNMQCARNEVDTATKNLWNQLKALGGKSPKLLPEDLVFVGVRDTEVEEDAIINRYGIKNYTVAELRSLGIAKLVSEIETRLADCDMIYISFDVDSMDPALTSHGTGTPVPNGLSPEESQSLILSLLKNPKVVCFELVEVNPCLDEKTNKMAETAFEIFQAIATQIQQN